jgi:hypothetical protein
LEAELEEFAGRGVDAGYASKQITSIWYISVGSVYILGACWSNYLVLVPSVM